MLISLFFLVPCICSFQITTPNLKYYQSILKSSSFWTTLNQELLIRFSEYPHSYSIAIDTLTSTSLQQNKNQQQNIECQIEQSYLSYKQMKFETNRLLDIYYLDMLVITSHEIIITITNNYIIQIIDLINGTLYDQFKVLNNSEITYIDGSIHLINALNKRSFYAINEQLSIYFEVDLNNTIVNTRQINLVSNKIIFVKRIDQSISNQLYIICEKGIDIYSIEDISLEYILTLGSKEFQRDPSIVDMDFDQTYTFLIVLDSKVGIQFIQFSGISYIVQPWTIFVKNGINLKVSGLTVIVIGKYLNNYYSAEIFFDITQQSYYFNRFYNEHMQFNSIYLNPEFAIIQGIDSHLLVYHSIFHGFVNNNLSQKSTFQEPFLIKIHLVHQKKDHQNNTDFFFLGLTADHLVKFKISSNLPYIKCKSDHQFHQKYSLTMNSTICADKEIKNDFSQFSQCQIFMVVEYSVFDDYIDTPQIWIVRCISIGIVLIILCVFLGGTLCWRKWKQSLQLLEKKIKLFKQQKYRKMFKDYEM